MSALPDYETVEFVNISVDNYSTEWSYNYGGSGPPQALIRSIYGIFGSIFVLGVLGNLMVIIAASRRLQGMHKTMSVFITNLSFADLLFLTFCMPFSAAVFTIPSYIFGNFICKFANFTMYASMLASIYTLVAMSLDRYIAVVYPLKFFNIRTFRNSLKTVLVIWAVSIAFSSPYLYVFTTESVNYTTHTEIYCVERWHYRQQRPRFHIFLFLCGYAVPFVVITVAYLRILCVLWRKFQPTTDGSQSNISKNKNKVTLMVCIVVTAFGFCWLPHHIINLWMGFGDFPFTMGTMIFKLFSLCISSFNSCLNPIIYSIMSDNFRHALVKAIRHVIWKRQQSTSRLGRQNRGLLLRQRYQQPYRHHHYLQPEKNVMFKDTALTKTRQMCNNLQAGAKTCTAYSGTQSTRVNGLIIGKADVHPCNGHASTAV